VFGGSDAVVWFEPSNEFPFVKGFVPIVISWFLSPLLAALITLFLFLIVRTLVLRRANSTKVAFWVLPVLMVLTFFINLFFILVSVLQPAWRRHAAFLMSQTCCNQAQHLGL
jgi:sodium-dependent phosphate transporter